MLVGWMDLGGGVFWSWLVRSVAVMVMMCVCWNWTDGKELEGPRAGPTCLGRTPKNQDHEGQQGGAYGLGLAGQQLSPSGKVASTHTQTLLGQLPRSPMAQAFKQGVDRARQGTTGQAIRPLYRHPGALNLLCCLTE